MRFEVLSLKHKHIIEKYNINSESLCDYSFNDLYLWKNYYNTSIFYDNDTLYIKCYINNEPIYYMPIGNIENGINNLIKYTRDNNENLRISNIYQKDLNYIPNSFRLFHLRGNDDYIYLTDELARLEGKKFKAKRNFVNSFKTKYNYTVELITTIKDEIIDFVKNIALDLEREPMLTALNEFNSLNLIGLVLKVDSKIVGITLGTLYNDTFIEHFEKVNYEYSGASQMINYLLANYLKDKAKYINREEDLGISGLRTAKLSYNPIKLIQCYSALYKDDYSINVINPSFNDIDNLINLWKKVFNDGDYSSNYLNNYLDVKNTYIVKLNDRITSMAIIMPYNNMNYLYALCTDPDYRGLGFAGRLLDSIISKYDNVFLIPSNEKIVSYYQQFEFKKVIASYSSTIKYNSEINIGYNTDLNINKLLEIYNKLNINKLERNLAEFEKILKLDSYKIIISNTSYAIYTIYNNKLCINEWIGSIDIVHMVMRHENIHECTAIGVTGDTPNYVMNNLTDDEYIYSNLLYK